MLWCEANPRPDMRAQALRGFNGQGGSGHQLSAPPESWTIDSQLDKPHNYWCSLTLTCKFCGWNFWFLNDLLKDICNFASAWDMWESNFSVWFKVQSWNFRSITICTCTWNCPEKNSVSTIMGCRAKSKKFVSKNQNRAARLKTFLGVMQYYCKYLKLLCLSLSAGKWG